MIPSVSEKLEQYLRQGSSPEKLALSLAVGIALGVFPIFGLTTLLCTLAAIVLRLNLSAVQTANYAMYPFQLALMLPLARLGERVFHARAIPFSLLKLSAMLQHDMFRTLHDLEQGALHALAGWVLIGPVLLMAVNLASLPFLRALAKRCEPQAEMARAASASR